jgi:hypothetical protein
MSGGHPVLQTLTCSRKHLDHAANSLQSRQGWNNNLSQILAALSGIRAQYENEAFTIAIFPAADGKYKSTLYQILAPRIAVLKGSSG